MNDGGDVGVVKKIASGVERGIYINNVRT